MSGTAVTMTRVRYRRAHWSPSTTTRTRYFARRADARRFADAVTARGGEVELSTASAPITWRAET